MKMSAESTGTTFPPRNTTTPGDSYALSKFADITFTYSLARMAKGSGVTANCLHPGVTDTKLLRSAFPGYPAITPEEGARTSVYLAISKKVTGVSGHYFDSQKPARSSDLTHDRSVQDRLWEIAEAQTDSWPPVTSP